MGAVLLQGYTIFENEMSGVNNLTDFNKVDSLFQNRLVNKFLEQGVLIKRPETSYFSYNTKSAKKVFIEPNVIIRNNVSIKSGSIIKSYSDLDGVLINENCAICCVKKVGGEMRFVCIDDASSSRVNG